MKTKAVIFFFVLFSSIAFSQSENGYKRTFKYGEYQPNWALVKTISGTYGFIDKEGNTIVQPVYAKIDKFTANAGEFALVKSITGTYGLINKTGKEVVPAIYAKIEDFGEYAADVALVKSITGTYGLINKAGKEVVSPIYKLEEIQQNFNALYRK